jgi:hypothetical protein
MANRKPTALHELTGYYKKNPGRRPKGVEPRNTSPLGDPPERLPVEARPFWHELADIAPLGVLTASDRWAVELAARFMAKAIHGPDIPAILELAKELELGKREIKNLINSQTISSTELSTLKSLLSSMGLTPVDRAKLSIPEVKPANRFSGFTDKPN